MNPLPWTLGGLLGERENRYGEKPYLLHASRNVSYAALNRRAGLLAGGLAQAGVQRGDRVAVWFHNCPEIIETYFALGKLGAVAVPINPTFTVREVRHVAADCGATAIVADGEYAAAVLGMRSELPAVREVVLAGPPVAGAWDFEALIAGAPAPWDDPGVAPDDPAMILYTSGTTGKPKGAVLSHRGLIENAQQVVAAVGFRDTDRSLCALPLYHLFAIAFDMLQMMVAGGSTAIIRRFEAEAAAQAIAAYRCTVFIGVPTMYIYLYNLPGRERYDLTSLRIGDTGGGPVPTTLKGRIEAEFGMTLLESYGLTEASPVVTIERPERERRAGSCGLPLPGLEVRVADPEGQPVPPDEVGQLLVRGPNVMKGYFGQPEETARTVVNGWLHTGDLVRQDADGYVYMVDRLKHMIICGGYNIYPAEVELVLFKHPAVLEVAVIGVPDAVKGELPKAVVALKPGHTVSAEELARFCRGQLAPYKVPRLFEFVAGLPKTTTGKIRKLDLKTGQQTGG